MSSKSYSIGNSKSKKSNSSTLKEILKRSIDIKPLLIIKIDDNMRLSLKNAVAKLAATLVAMISAISAFSLEILL